MDEIKIATQEEAGVKDEAVYALFQQAFRLWTDHGIDEPFLHYTLEEFKKVIHNSVVLVALDPKTGELLGSRTLMPRKSKRYIFECFLSVSPKYKNRGIATHIIQHEEEMVKKAGYDYLSCVTSVKAYWSIKWHLKNGYLIIGYFRPAGSNHYDYLFRKQLKPSLIWSGPLAPITAKICFIKSYAITRFCKTSSGELNLLGKIAQKMVRTVRTLFARKMLCK